VSKRARSTSSDHDPSQSGSALGRFFGTWPRRVGAIAGSALIAWAVGAFAPRLWEETSKRTGLAAAPVQVKVITDPDVFDTLDSIHNPEFVVRRPIDEIGPPPNGNQERGRYRWAKAIGGVDAFSSVVRLVISGHTSAPVTLHSLEVEKVEQGPPLLGAFLTYAGQGAGQPVRFFEIDLDRDPAEPKYLRKGQEAVVFPYRVSRGELEVFDIYAFTLRHHVRWRLRLHYTDEDGEGTKVIDNGGKPFEITAGTQPPSGASDVKYPHPYYWCSGHWTDDTVDCF
jgi:hypothetical protein